MKEQNELLVHTQQRGIRVITMNRPEVHNAFDARQIQRLTTALEAAAEDETVRVVVLAGNGKSFSAGGDIDYMRQMGENSYNENLDDAGRLAALMKTLNHLPKPTIARVQGAAMGGGVGLVCCCDYAIGSKQAKIALSEVKLGMIPATISPYVAATIGEKACRRMFMSGQAVDAEEALRLGFLSHIVAEDELDTAIASLSSDLADNGPVAVKLAKKLAFDVSNRPTTDTMIADTVKSIADIRDSGEGREGLTAFLEKRAPSWVNSSDQV